MTYWSGSTRYSRCSFAKRDPRERYSEFSLSRMRGPWEIHSSECAFARSAIVVGLAVDYSNMKYVASWQNCANYDIWNARGDVGSFSPRGAKQILYHAPRLVASQSIFDTTLQHAIITMNSYHLYNNCVGTFTQTDRRLAVYFSFLHFTSIIFF